ncbi:MAG: hypothetical protein L6Q57_04860 [Alphaproteobacteria bacterium]|nr:hypothetical protein [Alphaproteobacteria bacterium]
MTTAELQGKYLVHEYEGSLGGTCTEILYFSPEALAQLRARGIPSDLAEGDYPDYLRGMGAVHDDYVFPDGRRIPAIQDLDSEMQYIIEVFFFKMGVSQSPDGFPYPERHYERGYLRRLEISDLESFQTQWPHSIDMAAEGRVVTGIDPGPQYSRLETETALHQRLMDAGLESVKKAPAFVDPDIPEEDLIYARDFIRPAVAPAAAPVEP